MEETKGIEQVKDLSLEEHDVETLNTYLLSIQDSSGAFSQETFSTLWKLMKRDGKPKVLHVTCVLSCFQYFLEIDAASDQWQLFAEDVSKLCELAFTVSAMHLYDEELIKKLSSIASDMVERVQCMADPMLSYMLEVMLATAPAPNLSVSTRLLVLFSAATMLQHSSRQTRREIISRKAILPHLVTLSNSLLVCGDYEMQVSVMEVLARCRMFIISSQTDQPFSLFTDHPRAYLLFENLKFLNFDPECRIFLNNINNDLEDKRLIYSVSCMVVASEEGRFKKPIDPSYTEFWVDFNLGTRSLSFYHSTTLEEKWELMKVNEDSVVCVLAKNSACKSRSGQIIAAVKMELILKHDWSNPQLPKMLKLYLSKSSEFEKMEKIIIQKIFLNKYKTEITYSDLSQPNHSTASSSKANQCNDPRRVQSYTFAEMESVLPNELNDEQESESLNIKAPPSLLSTTVAPSQLNSNETSELRPDTELSKVRSSGESEEDSGDSLSFTRYIAERKNEEVREQDGIGNNLLKGEEMEIEEEESKECDTKYKTVEEKLGKMHEEIKNSSVGERAIKTNDESDSKKKMSVDSSRSGSPGVIVSDKREVDDKLLNVNSRKRQLYSNKNNNTKDIVLSSQDDFPVVNSVPVYKLRKNMPNKDPQKNRGGKNQSHPYISSRQKTKGSNGQSDNIYVDLNDSDQSCSDVEQCTKDAGEKIKTPASRKYFKREICKLSALNKTPEGTKTSNIFPENTLYSSFSSTKKTYAKPKPKKVKRVRVELMQQSSDSDPDYVPPVKVSSGRALSHHQDKTGSKKTNGETFVKKLPKNRVDPTREVKVIDENDLEQIDLYRPDPEPRQIDVPRTSLGTKVVPKRGLKGKKCSGENKKAVREKEKAHKGKKPVQTRQLCGGKGVEGNDNDGDCLEIVNYEPPESSTPEDEDYAWEILHHPMPQDKPLMQSKSQMNELLQFSRNYLKNADCRLKKLQNLAQKEREMNYAAFDFKVQAKCTSLDNQCQKLEAVSENLLKVKTLLDSSYNLQKDIAAQIQAEATQIEGAKKELIENLSKIEKSESSSIARVFQEMGKGLTNLVYSFFQKNSTKKAIPN